VLLVNLLAALNFANVFLNKKRLENEKNVKNAKRDQNKNVKTFFTFMLVRTGGVDAVYCTQQPVVGR